MNLQTQQFVNSYFKFIVVLFVGQPLSRTFVQGNEMKIVYTTSINSRTKFEQC